jgi:hypothetical protein
MGALAEMQDLKKEQREREFLLNSAKERVPQYQIASYLGITSVSLGCVR